MVGGRLQPPALVDDGDEILIVVNGLAEGGVVVEELLLRHLEEEKIKENLQFTEHYKFSQLYKKKKQCSLYRNTVLLPFT